MNVDKQELEDIHKILVRELKEIGFYQKAKNLITKKKLLETLYLCNSEKTFIDGIWKILDDTIRTGDYLYSGIRASLIYTTLIYSDCFQCAIKKHLPNLQIHNLLKGEKVYVNNFINSSSEEIKKCFLRYINEREKEALYKLLGKKIE